MSNLKFIDGSAVDPMYAASIANLTQILCTCEDEVGIDELETFAASSRIEKVATQKITFYFGDKPIGEVKFIKEGTKEDKINRCKKALMKKEIAKNPKSLIGQQLYSPFCNFKII